MTEEDHLGLSLESGGSYEKIGQTCNLSTEEAQEIADHGKALTPTVWSREKFPILVLLVLTELNETGSALRFRNEILASLFHTQFNGRNSDEEILGPYFEMVHKVKQIYQKGKTFFDMFSQ